MSETNRYAPIACFVYCRLDITVRMFETLMANDLAKQSIVYIFSDSWKTEEKKSAVVGVRKYIHELANQNAFKKVIIIENESNKGLARSLIDGISYVLDSHDKVIVLEDDIMTSPCFLEFMNKALNKYSNNALVGAISGYCYPINRLRYYQNDTFFVSASSSWGWATWKHVWEKVDWEVSDYKKFCLDKKARRSFEKTHAGIVKMLDNQMNGLSDSWAVRWDYHLWRNHLYTVIPKISLTRNEGIGIKGSTHCNNADANSIYNSKKDILVVECPSVEAISYIPRIDKRYGKYGKTSVIHKLVKIIKKRMHFDVFRQDKNEGFS